VKKAKDTKIAQAEPRQRHMAKEVYHTVKAAAAKGTLPLGAPNPAFQKGSPPLL
jgi:hypothetical protein